MRFGLIIRGQYPQGDDMRVRLQGRPRRRQTRRRTRLRPGRQGLALQFAPVPVHPADPLSLPGRMVAPKLRLLPRRRAAAAAQSAACGGGTRLARRHVRRQADLRRRHRLPRGGVQRLRLDPETIRQTLRGMPDRGEAPVVGRFRDHEGQLLQAGQRQLHDHAGAETDAAGVDRRQRQCRHPPAPPAWPTPGSSTRTTRSTPSREQMEVYKRALDDCGKPFPDELPMAREVFVAPTAPRRSASPSRPWKPNTKPIRTGARTR